MVEALDHGVALLTLQSTGTLVPARVLLKRLAVFSDVLKEERRPSEVSHVVSEHTSFGVMMVLLGGAPTSLVVVHEEVVAVFVLKHPGEVIIE